MTTLPDSANPENASPAPGDAPPPAPTAKPRRWRRYVLLAAMLLLACSLTLAWLTASRAGFVRLWQGIGRLSGQALTVQTVHGTLWSGFRLDGVRWRSQFTDVDIENLTLNWQPSALWHGELWLRELNVGHVRLTSRSDPNAPPLTAPTSLALPLTVRLERWRVASLTLQPTDVSLYDLQGRYRYDGQQHDVQLTRLGSPWGQASGRWQLGAATPFATHGALRLQGELEGVALSAQLGVSGSLLALTTNGQLQGRGMLATVQGQWQPFAPLLFHKFSRLDVRVGGINPQAILPSWPKGRLSLALQAQPAAGDRLKGGLALLNAEPGDLGSGQLPLSLLAGDFQADSQTLRWQNLRATLAGGSVALSGELTGRHLNLQALISRLSLPALHRAAPADTVSGQLHVAGPLNAPQLEARLQGSRLQAQARVGLVRSGREPHLRVSLLELRDGPGSLSVNGELGLAGTRRFSVQGRLAHLSPARWQSNLPVGDLNATLVGSGQLAEPLAAKLALQFTPSRLSGAPLAGQARLVLTPGRLQQLNADLHLASNRLQANGAYGKAGDRLRLLIDAPALGLLGPGFAGVVKGQAELAGTPALPLVSANLRASQLRLPGQLAVASLALRGELKADAASPFQLQLDASGVQSGRLAVEQLHARADGQRLHHRLQLDGRFRLDAHAYTLALAASGGLPAASSQWRGTLEKLTLTGTPGVRLLAPAVLEIGPARQRLANARWAALGGSVQLAEWLRSANGNVSSRGQANGLHLAELAAWWPLPLQQSLVLDGDWSFGYGPLGHLQLRRSAGDVWLPGQSNRPLALGLKQAALALQLGNGRAAATLALDSQYGTLAANGSLPWRGTLPDGRTPLAGTLQLNLPSLAVLAPLAGPSLQLGGQLSANLAFSGPLAQPQLQGRLSGQQLLLADHKTGIRLGDGQLQGRLDGRRLILERLRFGGGKGEVVANGVLDLKDNVPDATVRVTLTRFSVFDRPNRRLVVSGVTDLAFVNRKISLSGHLRADQGRVDLPKQGTPTLGDDVIVKGRVAAEPSAFASLPITVALDLDLGDRFRFTGQGLDVELTGMVRVTSSPGQAPAARGQVKVVKGRYKAYGQELDIQTGVITFAGPLDNPTLNVRANRRLSAVGAGVEVTGSVSSPRVRLVADEAMSDKDKLAYLVLGHAASSQRDDNALAASAGMMLAGSLNEQIGLFDDLGVASRKERTLANGTVSPAEQVVTVGRQLTRELYLGYEYGVTSAHQAVKLAYQLSKSWSLVLRAGTVGSAETRYTLRFD